MDKITVFAQLKSKNELLSNAIHEFELKITRVKRKYELLFKKHTQIPHGLSIFSSKDLDMNSPIKFHQSDKIIRDEIETIEELLQNNIVKSKALNRQKDHWTQYIMEYSSLHNRYRDLKSRLKRFDKRKFERMLNGIRQNMMLIRRYKNSIKSMTSTKNLWKQLRNQNIELYKKLPSQLRALDNQILSIQETSTHHDNFIQQQPNLDEKLRYITHNYASSHDLRRKRYQTKGYMLQLVDKSNEELAQTQQKLDKINKKHSKQSEEVSLFTKRYEDTLEKVDALKKVLQSIEIDMKQKKAIFQNLGRTYHDLNLKRMYIRQDILSKDGSV